MQYNGICIGETEKAWLVEIPELRNGNELWVPKSACTLNDSNAIQTSIYIEDWWLVARGFKYAPTKEQTITYPGTFKTSEINNHTAPECNYGIPSESSEERYKGARKCWADLGEYDEAIDGCFGGPGGWHY